MGEGGVPRPQDGASPAGRYLAALRSLVFFLSAWVVISSSAAVSYDRDVRPILSKHCYACHGPDEKPRKAGLRLDREDLARQRLESGAIALVPGDIERSALVRRITETDADEVMPPPQTKKPLSADQIDTLRRWVLEGARYEGHWAYTPPVRAELPAVKDPSWPKNALDSFVLARLEREGLKPSPPATKEKLLRRVSLDLTGLPPTVEELDAFLADTDAKAYETVVDRLLASPHYGERMAQMWLDLARYGETQGYHHDRHRDMWHWRDWVIQAFNQNLPYDRFTTEQLAGDLLPNPTRDQLIATGFHRNEMTTSEGGALPEEYLVKYVVGRVDTTARVWLGTSMACAECHDHKYDPISQREFYEFSAFFNQVPENGLDVEELNPVPRITLEAEADRTRLAQLDGEVRALEAAAQLALEAPQSAWDTGQAEWVSRHRKDHVEGWSPLQLDSSRVLSGVKLAQIDDHSIDLDSASSNGPSYELVFQTDETSVTGFRLETLPADSAVRATDQEVPVLLTGIHATARALRPDLADAAAGTPSLGHWYSLGPFPAASATEAFEKEFGPEKGVDLDARFLDGKLAWEKREKWNDGEPLALGGGNAAHYLFRTITVTGAQARAATFGRVAGIQVWLNGKSAFSSKPSPPADEAQARLWLRPGENRLLVKLSHGGNSGDCTFRLQPEPEHEVPVKWAAAAADANPEGRAIKGLIDDDPRTGWGIDTRSSNHVAWLGAAEPFGFAGGTEIRVRLDLGGASAVSRLGRFRLATSHASSLGDFIALPDEIRSTLTAADRQWTETAKQSLTKYYRKAHVPEVQTGEKLLAAKKKERDEFRNDWPSAMVMREADKERDTFLLIRGQYNNHGTQVTMGVPTRIFPWPDGQPTNRLGLARWLLDPQHPLTARVAVNQYWQRIFGTGIVKTAEEFGAQGEWPSHPELLDWLATEFIRSGWNIKAMQKLLVLSATYRQDSAVSRELLARDPENRLLARGPRYRLEAEGVRDVAMAVSGLLNSSVGGPSVYPYQPPGLWGQVSFEGTRDYVQSGGADNYRRGLYTYWRRSIPYASFTVFDAPSRETCTVRRPRTNTPLQALNLMNDPAYVEAARAFGQRILLKGGRTVDERIVYAVRVALSRDPTDAERRVLAAAVERGRRSFEENRAAANQLINVGASPPPVDVDIVELATWTVLGSTLLNLDETITRS